MASSGQWELVRKNPKKSKQNSTNNNELTKSQVREFIEKMPKLENMPHLKQSQTLYDAFRENMQLPNGNQKQPGKTSKNQNSKNASNANSNKNNAKQKKKLNEKKKVESPPKTLEEALGRINVTDLRALLDITQLRFPESPNLWLKDLVSFLNIKLNVDVADPVFNGKSSDYPLNVVSEDLRAVIDGVLKSCNQLVLQLFFERAVTEMADEVTKGWKTYGYRILIQAIAHKYPRIFIKNLSKYADLRLTYQNRPPACLSIMWAVGQGGVNDFEVGLNVWLEVMVPVLGMRAFSNYTVDYLRLLLSWHPNITSTKVLGVREFFPVFDTICNNNACLSSSLHKELLNLCPRLKSLAYGAQPESTLRNFFPSFLTRLQPSSSQQIKTELLSCLAYCLKTDVQCYSVWCQMYTRHFAQSSVLLEHLLKHWEKVGATLPHRFLKETVQAFNITNEELVTQGSKHVKDGQQECQHHCKELLVKMHKPSIIPWRLLIFVLVTVLTGVLIYDCQLHGGFKTSKTGRVLREYGVLNATEHVWTRSKHYSILSYQWAEKNIPQYYAAACTFCEPYFKILLAWLVIAKNYIVEIAAVIHKFFVTNTPIVLQWVDDTFPGLLAKLAAFFSEAWSFVLKLALLLWLQCVYYVQIVGTWLSENVFTGQLAVDKLQNHAYAAVDIVQTYTVEAFQWISQQLSSK